MEYYKLFFDCTLWYISLKTIIKCTYHVIKNKHVHCLHDMTEEIVDGVSLGLLKHLLNSTI